MKMLIIALIVFAEVSARADCTTVLKQDTSFEALHRLTNQQLETRLFAFRKCLTTVPEGGTFDARMDKLSLDISLHSFVIERMNRMQNFIAEHGLGDEYLAEEKAK